MLLQLLERMGACVLGEKPEAKRVQERQCFLWDRSLTRYKGWQAVQVYWLLPQKKWQGKVSAIRYNHTILKLSNPISPFYEPVRGNTSLPSPRQASFKGLPVC